MAAYASTVTSALLKGVKVDMVTGVYMFAGRCDVTNYNTTLVAITAISDKFRSIISVVANAISDNGYLVEWINASSAFKAYYATAAAAAHAHDFVVAAGTIGTNMEMGLDINTDSAEVVGAAGITADRTLNANTPVAVSGAVSATAALEVASDVDIGAFDFIAYGLG